VLDSLEFQRRGEAWELQVVFTTRVRYLRHAPLSRGDTIQIQIDPLALNFRDLPLLSSREALHARPGTPVPLLDVTYEGNRAAEKFLVVHFSRPVSYEVRPGADFRSILITVRDPAPSPALPTPSAPTTPLGPFTPPRVQPPATPAPLVEPAPVTPSTTPPREAVDLSNRFAVQLQAGPRAADVPVLPALPALEGRRVYTTDAARDGMQFRRVRVGFFQTRAEAERARGELAARFPDAYVVETSSDERRASAQSEIRIAASAPPRPSPPPAPPGPSGPEAAKASAPPGPSAPLPSPAPAPTVMQRPVPAPTPVVPLGADELQRSRELMDSGRAALTTGDADQAIRIFTKVVSMPEHEGTREAKELLGVARERRGQLAHAKAEYEEYLARYPDGDGATRVRQRLDALLTARAAPPPKLHGDGEQRGAGAQVEFHGSAATQYRREIFNTDATGSRVTDSALTSDVTLVSRARTESVIVRGLAAGSYLFDLAHGRSENEGRVSSLFVDVRQIEGPWAGIIGRQPGNTGGVSSRFDGLRLSRRIAPNWRIGVVGGLPVDIQHSIRFETGRYLYGLSLDANRLFDRFDGQLFALQQRADGLHDRTSVGGELRYADEARFLAAYVDYDVYYGSLNTALLTGNWQITSSTNLTLLYDYRNSPLLTTWNALQGQSVTRLGELRRIYSDSEIEALARDRTPRSTIASLGGTQQLLTWLQLALDVSASNLSATPASGGVDATDRTGWELAYFPQVIATGLLQDDDVATLGFRYFDGSLSSTYSAILTERYALTRRLRLTPRLRFDYRTRRGRDEFALRPEDTIENRIAAQQAARVRNGSYTVRPNLGVEYRLDRITFGVEGGYEWTSGAFSPNAGDETGYWLTFGIRYDF